MEELDKTLNIVGKQKRLPSKEPFYKRNNNPSTWSTWDQHHQRKLKCRL